MTARNPIRPVEKPQKEKASPAVVNSASGRPKRRCAVTNVTASSSRAQKAVVSRIVKVVDPRKAIIDATR